MSYETYKVLHLLGIFMVVGGLTARPFVGNVQPGRKLAAMTHGGGLLVVLIAGFGMLARLQLQFTGQAWLVCKLVVWLLLGGLIAVAARKPQKAGLIWLLTFVLAAFAGYCAIYKFT